VTKHTHSHLTFHFCLTGYFSEDYVSLGGSLTASKTEL